MLFFSQRNYRRELKETDLHLFSEVLDLKLTSDLDFGFEREPLPQMSTRRTSNSSSTTEPSTFEVQSLNTSFQLGFRWFATDSVGKSSPRVLRSAWKGALGPAVREGLGQGFAQPGPEKKLLWT